MPESNGTMLRARCAALALAGALAGGCATTGNHPEDPLEGYNRAMFAFNEQVDRALLKPAAQAYETVVPSPLRTGVGNVFGNLGDPWIGINNLLQGKVADALSDMMRFVVNTTLGFVGILDIATEAGLPKHDEDFGQTLGAWGVASGPYFVLPVLGPRTLRDTATLAVDMMADPVAGLGHIPTRNALTGLRLVHVRATLLGTEKTLDEGTLDKYAYMRDFYLEQRRYKVFDGNPPRIYEDFNGDEAALLPAMSAAEAVARSSVESLELIGVGDPMLLAAARPANQTLR